jgi:hypothetical protein
VVSKCPLGIWLGGVCQNPKGFELTRNGCYSGTYPRPTLMERRGASLCTRYSATVLLSRSLLYFQIVAVHISDTFWERAATVFNLLYDCHYHRDNLIFGHELLPVSLQVFFFSYLGPHSPECVINLEFLRQPAWRAFPSPVARNTHRRPAPLALIVIRNHLVLVPCHSVARACRRLRAQGRCPRFTILPVDMFKPAYPADARTNKLTVSRMP